jgi:hypothetical protein
MDCPPALEVVALWAHGANLLGWVDLVREDLLVLPKQLQRDYPLSAQKLEKQTDELSLFVQNYEMTRASRGFIYLEPDEFARDHWRGFRLWRNQLIEAAELGGGKLGRIQAVKLTSTYPVDVVSVANDIIEELAPIARDIADRVPKATTEQEQNGQGEAGETPSKGRRKVKARSMKGRFTFRAGQALFNGKDLDLPSDAPITVLKRLVDDFGRVVPYTDFDPHYTSATPGTLPKSVTKIRKSFRKKKVPCEIKPRTGVGYFIREIPSSPKRKKRVRKKS